MHIASRSVFFNSMSTSQPNKNTHYTWDFVGEDAKCIYAYQRDTGGSFLTPAEGPAS